MVDMGFKPLKALPFRVTRVFKYGENHTVTEANMTTYRIIRSKYAGKCQVCENAWKEGDMIYQCVGRYYDRVACVQHNEPDAYLETSKENKELSPASVTTSNASRTERVVGETTRWEIVTGDDGIIVLRRLP